MTLEELKVTLGDERRIAVCKELTKKHEILSKIEVRCHVLHTLFHIVKSSF